MFSNVSKKCFKLWCVLCAVQCSGIWRSRCHLLKAAELTKIINFKISIFSPFSRYFGTPSESNLLVPVLHAPSYVQFRQTDRQTPPVHRTNIKLRLIGFPKSVISPFLRSQPSYTCRTGQCDQQCGRPSVHFRNLYTILWHAALSLRHQLVRLSTISGFQWRMQVSPVKTKSRY